MFLDRNAWLVKDGKSFCMFDFLLHRCSNSLDCPIIGAIHKFIQSMCLLWGRAKIDYNYDDWFKKHWVVNRLAKWCNTLHRLVWQIDEANYFDLLCPYFCFTSRRCHSSRQAWTTPSPCLRSRWHVCSPTPSSAPSPDATPEGKSTGIIRISTSSGGAGV